MCYVFQQPEICAPEYMEEKAVYRRDHLDFSIFASAASIVILIAVITLALQTVKAAVISAVDELKAQ